MRINKKLQERKGWSQTCQLHRTWAASHVISHRLEERMQRSWAVQWKKRKQQEHITTLSQEGNVYSHLIRGASSASVVSRAETCSRILCCLMDGTFCEEGNDLHLRSLSVTWNRGPSSVCKVLRCGGVTELGSGWNWGTAGRIQDVAKCLAEGVKQNIKVMKLQRKSEREGRGMKMNRSILHVWLQPV